MPTPAEQVATALERWRNNLIDLTRRNPLLSLKPNHTSYLEIVQPDLMKVYDQLYTHGIIPWLFYLPPETDKKKKVEKKEPTLRASELLTGAADRAELLKILTNLYRRALTDYRERGLHILHLALGILEWRDEAEETFRSPVLLLPVQLERHSLKDPFQLTAVDEDPIVNPALAARLKQDFDFRLPAAPSDWEEKKPDQYLAELKSAISGLPGWAVHSSVVLSPFSFLKGVIVQDLQDNAERVRTHPILQALAGAPPLVPTLRVGTPQSVPVEEKEPDAKETCYILDADSSQTQCLTAAARGESFVLIGPPGTGKSQTIANLIADSIAQGKKVLFVSEKMAALEVVYKRLCAVNLGAFCLELHSHKANKREVIKELARCCEEKLTPQPTPSDDDFTRLAQRRDALSRYVQSLHMPREPMRKSAWDALAELPRWQELPMVPLGLPTVRQAGDTTTKLTLAEFTPGHLDELQQLLQRLQHHWHIRTDANYPWRGFKADRYSLQLRDEIVGLIDRIRSKGDKLRAAAEQYAAQLGVPRSIAGLLKLGDLLEKRPAHTLPAWLTTPDLAGLIADFEKCAEQYHRLGEGRKPLTERYGPALWKLPSGSAVKIEQAWKHAATVLAPGDERGADFLKHQHKLRAWTAETQKRIPGWIVELRALEKWLAVPLAVGAGSTVAASSPDAKFDPAIATMRAFLRLATLCVSDAPLDKSWLEDRNVLKEAQAVIAATKPAFVRYKHNRQHLKPLYSDKLYDLDLQRIAAAYAGRYQSWWCVFSWQYRKDRRAIAKTRPMEDLPPSVAKDMQLAGQVHEDKATIEAVPELGKRLGRYDKGLDTDIETADRAVRHASEALDLCGLLDCDRLPVKCVEALVSGSPPEKVRAALKRVNESFVGWTHQTHELQAILLPSPGTPGEGSLDDCSLSGMTQYARHLQTALNLFASLCDPLLDATPPTDMQTLVADLKQAEELLALEAAQATEAARWTARFGTLFQGVATDWDALRKAIAWAQSVRECLGLMQGGGRSHAERGNEGPVGDKLLQAATGTPPSSRDLRKTLEPYEHDLHALEHRFDAPGPTLDGKPLREHSPETVLDLLTKWRDRVGELTDWVDWRYLPERFGHLGLKSFWDHLQQHDIVREQVVGLFLKSFWSGWLDAMFQQDPVLGQYRRDAHEQTLREFQELDRRMIAQGGARIAALLDSQQSQRAGDPEVALLMKEAHKKTKHLPLRQLFDSLSSLLLRLKPCMLMSPLSVSQFLPADPGKLQFDVIVFDEASQILPEDAVGAIYRGKQLIVTGDNQQLPPTTFFQQNAGDGGDMEEEESPLFESVLDASLGAGLQRRTLHWHYRSRHEHLIAFSNESFYEGRLVTFPAASDSPLTPRGSGEKGDKLGVQLQHVADGVYDRGGRRDNPREAQVVAGLVLDHFSKSPDKTLGVIAFSYAQMDAIEDEIERRLREQPKLEGIIRPSPSGRGVGGEGDRLEGFFVKNLETVQGDERDVILLSVGYGRDALGKIELNFGPLNREGGERRLNVAVTRARERLIVVSSIRARDLNLGNTQAKGLIHLQRYLDFAERGMAALVPDAVQLPTTGLHDDVMRELKTLGYESAAFVGCGVCRLDIGVRDRQQAGRFVLGIEFDGPMYAQPVTVRDRDRLRTEMLAKLGWKLHRIWSPDWVFRKQEEIARLQRALQ